MSNLNKKPAGGRPPDSFITANFTQAEKKTGNTNRWYFTCNHCNEKLEHRDSRLLNHIKDITKCRNAPPNIREAARHRLAEKGGILLTDVKEDMLPEPSQLQVVADGTNAENNGNPIKKRKSEGSITRFLEKPLSQEEADKNNVRLLRYVLLI